jgi:TetR/AcrR family transcriptional repressor of nem operon
VSNRDTTGPTYGSAGQHQTNRKGDQGSEDRGDGSRATWLLMTANELVAEPHRLTPKGRATRDRIVVAAAQLMYDHSVAGTSLGDVQKAAGVGASQMYHYFEDRQSLIRAVIAYRVQNLLETLQPNRGGLDSMEALRAWRDFVVDTLRQRNCEGGCPLGSLVGELAELFPECRGDLAGGFDQWEAAIRKGLQAMCDRGDLRRKADPGRLATALLAAAEGGILLAQLRRDPAPLETALDEVLDRIEDLRPRRAQAHQ